MEVYIKGRGVNMLMGSRKSQKGGRDKRLGFTAKIFWFLTESLVFC